MTGGRDVLFLEQLAVEMLGLAPSITRWWDRRAQEYALAVWISRLYGYDLVVRRQDQDNPGGRHLLLEAVFTRVDEPGARRRAEWMRNPAADPAYAPPVSWHLGGGPGFHPPGWHPSARLVVTPEVQQSLRYNEDQYVRVMHDTYGVHRIWTRGTPASAPPPGPAPPPPPDTIAFPDEDRRT